MRFSKLFILTLLLTGHFYNANAMEKETDSKDLIGNIRTIKVTDRPDITYDGRIGHGAGYRELEVYKLLSKILQPVTDYFVYSEEDTKSYTRRTSPRLYDLCLTRWERIVPKTQHRSENIKNGLIVLWNILPSSGHATTSKDQRKQLYAGMRQETCMMSLKSLLTHLTEDNNVYYYETFPSNHYKDMLLTKRIKEIWCAGNLLNI